MQGRVSLASGFAGLGHAQGTGMKGVSHEYALGTSTIFSARWHRGSGHPDVRVPRVLLRFAADAKTTDHPNPEISQMKRG